MAFLENLRTTGIFEPGALAGLFQPKRKPESQIVNPTGITPNMETITGNDANAAEIYNRQLNQIAQQAAAPQNKPMNVVFDNNIEERKMTLAERESRNLQDYRTGSLAIDRDRLRLDREKGELAELKNQQIYDIKIADMERKVTDSERNLKLAYDRLNANQEDKVATQMFRQAQLDAMNARQALELAQRDRQLQENQRMNDARINQIGEQLNQQGYQMQEITDDTGAKRTTITRRGEQPMDQNLQPSMMPNQPQNTTPMMGDDGEIYFVPNDQVKDAVTTYNMRYVDPTTGKVK